MDAVQRLYDVSVELLFLLEKNSSSDNRDQLIQEIESYLKEREEMMKIIKPPYTQEEEKVGGKLIEVNRKIDHHLASIKKEIQFDLCKLKNNKVSKEKYQDPYQTGTLSGLFYDKRN